MYVHTHVWTVQRTLWFSLPYKVLFVFSSAPHDNSKSEGNRRNFFFLGNGVVISLSLSLVYFTNFFNFWVHQWDLQTPP